MIIDAFELQTIPFCSKIGYCDMHAMAHTLPNDSRVCNRDMLISKNHTLKYQFNINVIVTLGVDVAH